MTNGHQPRGPSVDNPTCDPGWSPNPSGSGAAKPVLAVKPCPVPACGSSRLTIHHADADEERGDEVSCHRCGLRLPLPRWQELIRVELDPRPPSWSEDVIRVVKKMRREVELAEPDRTCIQPAHITRWADALLKAMPTTAPVCGGCEHVQCSLDPSIHGPCELYVKAESEVERAAAIEVLNQVGRCVDGHREPARPSAEAKRIAEEMKTLLVERAGYVDPNTKHIRGWQRRIESLGESGECERCKMLTDALDCAIANGERLSRTLDARTDAPAEVWVRVPKMPHHYRDMVVRVECPGKGATSRTVAFTEFDDNGDPVYWCKVPVHGSTQDAGEKREGFTAPGFPSVCSFCGGSHSFIVVGPGVCICVDCAQRATKGKECSIPGPDLATANKRIETLKGEADSLNDQWCKAVDQTKEVLEERDTLKAALERQNEIGHDNWKWAKDAEADVQRLREGIKATIKKGVSMTWRMLLRALLDAQQDGADGCPIEAHCETHPDCKPCGFRRVPMKSDPAPSDLLLRARGYLERSKSQLPSDLDKALSQARSATWVMLEHLEALEKDKPMTSTEKVCGCGAKQGEPCKTAERIRRDQPDLYPASAEPAPPKGEHAIECECGFRLTGLPANYSVRHICWVAGKTVTLTAGKGVEPSHARVAELSADVKALEDEVLRWKSATDEQRGKRYEAEQGAKAATQAIIEELMKGVDRRSPAERVADDMERQVFEGSPPEAPLPHSSTCVKCGASSASEALVRFDAPGEPDWTWRCSDEEACKGRITAVASLEKRVREMEKADEEGVPDRVGMYTCGRCGVGGDLVRYATPGDPDWRWRCIDEDACKKRVAEK